MAAVIHDGEIFLFKFHNDMMIEEDIVSIFSSSFSFSLSLYVEI